MTHDQLEAAHPDAPWMWKEEWVQGRIKGQSGGVTMLCWVMALLWNGFLWPVLIFLWDDPERRAMVKVIMLFCLVGLGILLWAIRNTIGWFRFGSSVFELTSNPGVIGGTLEGLVHTRLGSRPEAAIQVTLTCARQVTTQSRSGKSTTTRIDTEHLWQTGRTIRPDMIVDGPHGLSIPVRIEIPIDLPGTDDSDPKSQIIWTLTVSADVPGVDFDACFTVPVFVTDDSDPELTRERIDEAAEAAGPAAPPPAAESSWVPPVSVRWTRRGGVEYTFRPAVSLKAAVGLSLLAVAVCAGSAWLWMWLEEAGPFALIPAAIGALLLLATAVVWTFKSRVLVERGTISVRTSLLGIPRIRRIPFSDFKRVRVQRELVEGVEEKDLDWELIVERHSGVAEVDLGASFARRSDAVRVAGEIENLVY